MLKGFLEKKKKEEGKKKKKNKNRGKQSNNKIALHNYLLINYLKCK